MVVYYTKEQAEAAKELCKGEVPELPEGCRLVGNMSCNTSDLKEYDYKIFAGPPKPTETHTQERLLNMGMVGQYLAKPDIEVPECLIPLEAFRDKLIEATGNIMYRGGSYS